MIRLNISFPQTLIITFQYDVVFEQYSSMEMEKESRFTNPHSLLLSTCSRDLSVNRWSPPD